MPGNLLVTRTINHTRCLPGSIRDSFARCPEQTFSESWALETLYHSPNPSIPNVWFKTLAAVLNFSFREQQCTIYTFFSLWELSTSNNSRAIFSGEASQSPSNNQNSYGILGFYHYSITYLQVLNKENYFDCLESPESNIDLIRI